MNKKFKLIPGEIIWVHEESCQIRYSGVNDKSHRPHLFIKTNFVNNKRYFVFLPLISSKTNNGLLRIKKEIWYSITWSKYEKQNYVLLDFPFAISYSKFIHHINSKIDLTKHNIKYKQFATNISYNWTNKLFIKTNDLKNILKNFDSLYK